VGLTGSGLLTIGTEITALKVSPHFLHLTDVLAYSLGTSWMVSHLGQCVFIVRSFQGISIQKGQKKVKKNFLTVATEAIELR